MTTNGDGTARGIPASERGPRGFRIVTPANWYVLDLDPATRSRSIAQLVERRVLPGDDPRLVRARRDLTALLRGAARDAEENGAVYAALMDVVVDRVALSASVIAMVGDAPLDEDGHSVVDPQALAGLLNATDAVRPATRSDGNDEAMDKPEVINLPAGPAVRLRRIKDTGQAGSADETAKAAETQYFIVMPDTTKVLILTFGTPNVDFRWHFEELFDRIAQTLEWRQESQPE